MTATIHRLPTPAAQIRANANIVAGDFASTLAGFLDHAALRGASKNTLLAYGADLARFAQFMRGQDIGLVALVSERLMNRWVDAELRIASTRSTARRLSTIRSYLSWCRIEGYLTHDPSALVRVSFRPRLIVAPELDELKRVIAAIGTTTPIDLRDRAILMLLLDAGLRASEPCALDLDGPAARYCVRAARLCVHVPRKGSAESTDVVAIEQQTVKAVLRWIGVREQLAKPGETALFVHERGRRIARASVHGMVVARGRAVGVKLHPHLFRHRRIGSILETVGLDAGRSHARHANKATTLAVYGTHVDQVLRAAIREHAPLGEVG